MEIDQDEYTPVSEILRMLKRERMKQAAKLVGITLLTVAALYFVVAANVWMARNPKANQLQVWANLESVVTFGTIEDFQQ